ncbi:MAG: GNAT family N-acetyltransferase [Caldisericia bacterium]|nr:GNAT family N-acetyltransferase [Caldisericia bacterium]
MNIEIRKVEKEELLGDLYQTYRILAIRDFADMYPEESTLNDEIIRTRLENKNYDESNYFAFLDGQMIGYSDISRPSRSNPAYEQNKNRIGFWAFILPEYRKQGLGVKLLTMALEDPLREYIQRLRTSAYSADGRRFVESLGGKVVEKSSTRELLVKDIDWELVESWKNMSFSPDKKPVIEFHSKIDWQIVEQFLDLSFEINLELSQMDNREFIHTRESEEHDWKEMLEYWGKTGFENECFILKDSAGSTIGYTMCIFSSRDPDTVGQSMTAVWKHLRGNGYGQLLKALMLENIRTNHPQIVKINTSNNDLNDPMVGINRKLGFVEKSLWCSYIVDYSEAIEKLRSKK